MELYKTASDKYLTSYKLLSVTIEAANIHGNGDGLICCESQGYNKGEPWLQDYNRGERWTQHHKSLKPWIQIIVSPGRWDSPVVNAFARLDEEPGSIHSVSTICEANFWCSKIFENYCPNRNSNSCGIHSVGTDDTGNVMLTEMAEKTQDQAIVQQKSGAVVKSREPRPMSSQERRAIIV